MESIVIERLIPKPEIGYQPRWGFQVLNDFPPENDGTALIPPVMIGANTVCYPI